VSGPQPIHTRLLESVSEKDWQAQVIELALLNGWWPYHPFDSRRSEPGYPDLTLIRPPRLVFAELKTERGRLSIPQRHIIDLLRECPGIEVYVWRPSDWDEVARTLARHRRARDVAKEVMNREPDGP
jgi:hypothetical protein